MPNDALDDPEAAPAPAEPSRPRAGAFAGEPKRFVD